MSTPSSSPVSFERLAKAKAVGCIAYVLMIPMVTITGAILAGSVGAGIAWLLGGGETLRMALLLVFGIIGLLGSAAFGIRDYRRRSVDCIQIHDDRLEEMRGGKADLTRFDEILWIEGPALTGLTLRPKGRRILRLLAEEWPIDRIREALVQRAVPAMVRVMHARIEAGETLEFRPARLMGLRLSIVGTALVALSGYLFFLWTRLKVDRNPVRLGLPFFLFVTGATSLAQVARARGGVLIDRDGVRVRKGDPVIPWPRLRLLSPEGSGMILETDDGRKIRIGMLTRNYEACVAILKSGMAAAQR